MTMTHGLQLEPLTHAQVKALKRRIRSMRLEPEAVARDLALIQKLRELFSSH